MSSENDKENNVGVSECRTIDATPEPLSQIHNNTTSPKLEVDNMGLYKLPLLKNQPLRKLSDASPNYPSLDVLGKLNLHNHENGAVEPAKPTVDLADLRPISFKRDQKQAQKQKNIVERIIQRNTGPSQSIDLVLVKSQSHIGSVEVQSNAHTY